MEKQRISSLGRKLCPLEAEGQNWEVGPVGLEVSSKWEDEEMGGGMEEEEEGEEEEGEKEEEEETAQSLYLLRAFVLGCSPPTPLPMLTTWRSQAQQGEHLQTIVLGSKESKDASHFQGLQPAFFPTTRVR